MTDDLDLHGVTDAAVWTDEFLQRFAVRPHDADGMDPADQWGLMVSWFASAIAARYRDGVA